MQKIVQQTGPFTVIPLNRNSANSISVGEHGMEKVECGTKTKNHTHRFLSLYLAVGLVLTSGGKKYPLPPHALVIVPPGTDHSWTPARKSGKVGSIDKRHAKQIVLAA